MFYYIELLSKVFSHTYLNVEAGLSIANREK